MGDRQFQTGDRWIRSVAVELSEDERGSNCRFEVYDPGLKLAGEWFAISFKKGGIEVPPNLLESPQPVAAAGGSAASGATGSITLPSGSGGAPILQRPTGKTFEAQKEYYTNVWNTMGLDEKKRSQLEQAVATALQNKARYQKVVQGTSVPWQFVAATHYRESSYAFNKHLHNGDPLNQVTRRVPAGRGPFATWEESARDVLFTMKKLDQVSDWSPAGLAWQFEKYNGLGYLNKGRPSPYLLAGSQHYAGGMYVSDGRYNASVVDPRVGCLPIVFGILQTEGGATATEEPTKEEPETEKEEKPVEKTETVEESKKGTEIVIELGFSIDQMIAYHFIHVGTNAAGRSLDTTTFEGKSIRWLMTRRTKNATYKDITLRQLAEKVAKAHGLTLEMDGNGTQYQHLDQTGLTDYELLLRECRALGYRLYDEGGKLIIKPWRPEFSGFVITPDMVDRLEFADKASSDRAAVPSTTESKSDPKEESGESKFWLDRFTGKPKQQRNEDKSATGNAEGDAPGRTFTTGADKKPVSGTPKAEEANSKSADKKEETEGKKEEESGSRDIPPESVTGLPRQPIGTVDLSDGKAEAVAIKDESRRVKGYESSATFKATQASLTLAPGSIIGLAEELFDNQEAREAFAREWRVGSVRHEFQSGVLTTSIQFYTPQKQKEPQAEPQAATATTGAATTEAVTGSTSDLGFQHPQLPLEGRSSCGAKCEFGTARGRWHRGIDYGGGHNLNNDVLAVGDGVVEFAAWVQGNGAGQMVTIAHTGKAQGWKTRYMHLETILVKQGQEVKRGQKIGIEGGSGFGKQGAYARHLHFEAINPSGKHVDPRSVLPRPGLKNFQTGRDENNSPQ